MNIAKELRRAKKTRNRWSFFAALIGIVIGYVIVERLTAACFLGMLGGGGVWGYTTGKVERFKALLELTGGSHD